MFRFWCAVSLTWCCAATAAGDVRPNVIVMLADDQGWGDLSLHGNLNLSTPHLDGLARDGARFETFFVCPVCAPTRAEFLTGRYHPRSGVHGVSAGAERMNLDEVTIADSFAAAGYATAVFGKWHNGTQYPYHPNGRGFGTFYGFCSGHWGHYFSPMLERDGQPTRGEGYVTDDFTNQAIRYIEGHRDSPFFVYLALNTPHSPMQVPDAWWSQVAHRDLPLSDQQLTPAQWLHQRAALAMCENIDWNVGRVLERLDELKLADKTIVVYFSDNGPNGRRWNGGLKGMKGSTDEGGVRSPLFIRWPAGIQPGTRIQPIAAAIDLLPTLTALAGVPHRSTHPLDGLSLAPLLIDASGDWPHHRMIFSHWRDRTSVRTDKYRLDDQGRLFDMVADPGQRHDLAAELPEQAEQLAQAITAWRRDVQADQKNGRPFLIGHRDFRYTQLPARDATTIGNLQRSSRHPNCSYFTNWTSLEDRITWDVEIRHEGEYLVEAYYTCPPADVGASITLELAGRELATARVEVAHDPPLQGAAHDRIPRSEGYVKDFRPLVLGTVKLTCGRGALSLRARSIPGSQVMDFRMMMFTRHQ